MSGFLTEAADTVAAILTAHYDGTGVGVYSVTTPGYAQLTTPCLAVDAPTLDEWAAYHSGRPHAAVSVPIRVLPRSSDAGAELVALADETLAALHDSQMVTITAAVPTVAAAGQGITSALPTYSLSVTLNVEA